MREPYLSSTWWNRRRLPHAAPAWIDRDAAYLVTVCCQPRAMDHLCNSGRAPVVIASIRFRHERGDWRALACVVMPDHVHLLARFTVEQDVRRIVTDWKRYVARTAGIRWQRDFFEHRLRGDDLVPVKVHYLRRNPVRAGLVASAEDWPYFWAP